VGPQQEVLATKLRAPRLRPGWVARRRLIERLRAGSGRELVLVCGPAGFGKSSMLADWVRGIHSRPTGWLSLDEDDNDPVRFWRHVSAALNAVLPGVADRASALVAGPPSQWLASAVTTLINDLAASDGAGGGDEHIGLVLDDYHVISSGEVHRSLELLLGNMPEQLRLIIATRADPPLPLARLRARGQLAEIRGSDLRFTRGESAQLLRAACGHDLPDAVVAALEDRTEGWAAGLHLAALSLQGREDTTGFVEHFSGSHRYVLDYLTEEVLEQQPEHIRTFLLETSVLERLSGPLCDDVLGREGSQQMLEQIERANLFLLPLDDSRRWWRYHHLFADLLRAQSWRRSRARTIELHCAAAEWYENVGLADDAIRHALTAGDAERAAQLVERYLDEQILGRAETTTLTRWLSALPVEVLHRRARLPLGQGVLALMMGRLDEADRLLDLAEQTHEEAGPSPLAPSIPVEDSMLANVPAAIAVSRAEVARLRGDSDAQGRFARLAQFHLTTDDHLLTSMASYHVATAAWAAGELSIAEPALAQIVEDRIASAEHRLALRGTFDLGAIQRAQGRLSAALRTYQRGLDVARHGGSPPNIGIAHVGMAEVLYERDELDAATEHVLAGIENCRRYAFGPPLVTGLVVLAKLHRAGGDDTACSVALDEAEALMPQVSDLRIPVAAVRARLALVDGDPSEAYTWARAHGAVGRRGAAYAREADFLLLARLWLTERDPGDVVGLLEPWRELAASQLRTASLIELALVTALAHATVGDQQAAMVALAESLTLAAPERHIRTFVDEGAAVADLLRELLVGRRLERLAGADTVPREFLADLAAAFERAGTPVLPTASAGAVAVAGLVEPLSARELEVLVLLTAGHSNRVIADRLFIGLDTVKRHVTHIFGKLGVANRTQAAARARELELVT
jgi:LuxR family maltose regulon positive regulatory protein